MHVRYRDGRNPLPTTPCLLEIKPLFQKLFRIHLNHPTWAQSGRCFRAQNQARSEQARKQERIDLDRNHSYYVYNITLLLSVLLLYFRTTRVGI